MLSAFAARKAAQAQTPSKSEKSSGNESKNGVEEIDDEEKQLKTILSSSSKRKSTPSVSFERSRKKPKKKDKSDVAGFQNLRYFHSPQDNVDAISQDEGSSSTSSEDETDLEPNPRINSDEELLPEKTRRAWSPSQPVHEGSESAPEDERMDDRFITKSSMSNDSQNQDRRDPSLDVFSNFVPQLGLNVFNLCDDTGNGKAGDGTIVLLNPGETLALLGTYNLTVLAGRVNIQGTPISADKHTSHSIFAARCFPIPVILPEASRSSDDENLHDLPSHIRDVIQGDSTVLLLQDLHSGVEDLERVCSSFSQNFEPAARRRDELGLSTSRMLTTGESGLRPWVCPPSWKTTLQKAVPMQENSDEGEPVDELSSPVILVKGAKRTGKSTMARTVLNRLLGRYRRVAFLETDLGQSEFNPPGLVSLHILDRPIFGPSFTHHLDPHRAHYIGSTSPRYCPSQYIASIRNLAQVYRLEVQYSEIDGPSHDNRIDGYVPLVVNTMGWTKGLGANLAQQIEQIVEPSHIISIQNSYVDADEQPFTPVHVLKSKRATEGSGGPHIFNVDAIPSDVQNQRYAAADWRTLSLMSYFYMARSPNEKEARGHPLWDTRTPLVSRRPYQVSVKKAFDGIFLVGPNSEDVIPSEISTVLNGALVALVSLDLNATMDSSPVDSTNESFQYAQGAQSPDPASSHCIGLAVIRGLTSESSLPKNMEVDEDVENPLFHIITPVSLSAIKFYNCRYLVKGELELPVWGMIDVCDFEQEKREENTRSSRSVELDLPYLQWGNHNGAIGSERRRVRRNLMRRSQM